MIRVLLRALGFLLGLGAFAQIPAALWFRIDSAEELRTIELIDLALGGAFALAFVLVFIPKEWKAPRAWIVTAIGAAVVWLCVSGSLIWTHREQVRIRSGGRTVDYRQRPSPVFHSNCTIIHMVHG
jgi:hypothetical protein